MAKWSPVKPSWWRHTRRGWRLVTVMLVLATVRPGEAVDGVTEINQARALAGSVTPGDTPGFPVTLSSSSSSYRLTGDLTVPSVNTNAIELPVGAEVTLDLNGFQVTGPATCTATEVEPPTISCSSTGTGQGISGGGGPVTIKNGVIRGMGSHCINAPGGRVENVNISLCGGDGIRQSTIVRNVHVSNVGGNGIEAIEVSGSFVEGAGAIGIRATLGATDNRVIMAVGEGIQGGNLVVRGNTLYRIGGRAVVVGGGTVSGNHVDLCGRANVPGANQGVVFTGGLGGVVTDNSISRCLGVAIEGTGVGYSRNVLVDNNGGSGNPQVPLGLFETGTNVCGTDTVCP